MIARRTLLLIVVHCFGRARPDGNLLNMIHRPYEHTMQSCLRDNLGNNAFQDILTVCHDMYVQETGEATPYDQKCRSVLEADPDPEFLVRENLVRNIVIS